MVSSGTRSQRPSSLATNGYEAVRRSISTPFGGGEESTRATLGSVVERGIPGALTDQPLSGNLIRRVLRLAGRTTITHPYIQAVWAYACMNAVAKSFSQAPLRVYASEDPTEPEILPTDPRLGELPKLLRTPNLLPMSGRKFWKTFALHQQMSGGSVFLMFTNNRPTRSLAGERGLEIPEELWPVRFDLVEADLNETTHLPEKWRFQTETGEKEHPARAAAAIYDVDPHNPLRSVGPTAPAYRPLQQDFVADRYNEALLENGGAPGFALLAKGPVSAKQRDQLRENFRRNHQAPQQHRKVAVIPFDMELKELGFNPLDMEFSKMRFSNREAIMAAYGVTPTVLGITENVNKANARVAMRVFWEQTVIPLLGWVREELLVNFVHRLKSPFSTLDIRWDLSRIPALREDRDAIVKRIVSLWGIGVSLNDAARISGAELDRPLEGGDDRFLPSSVVPADQIGQQDDTNTGHLDDEDEEERSIASKARIQVSELPKLVKKTPTRAQRAALLQAYDKALIPFDAKLSKRLARQSREFILATRIRLRELSETKGSANGRVRTRVVSDDELIFLQLQNLQNWKDVLAEDLDPILTEIVEEFGAQAVVEVGAPSNAWNLAQHPSLTQFVSEAARRIADRETERIAERVRRAIQDSLDEDGTVGELAARVRAALEEIEKELKVQTTSLGQRAQRIARTETTTIASLSMMAGFCDQGVLAVEWLSSGDDFVREEHVAINAEVRPLLCDATPVVPEPFIAGGAGVLRYPGDPEAPPELAIECRCRLLPVLGAEDQDS